MSRSRKYPLLLIACGALAREIMAVLELSKLPGVEVQCLPAKLHNTPQFIPEAVRAKIRAERRRFERIFVLYGDCGTGGLLDAMLAEEGVERIGGAHCYEFFTGAADFAALADEEAATFYLTDYLVRQFDRLVIEGLGIDRHPELLPMYFGNYKRVVYLAQKPSPKLLAKARAAAERLGLAFEHRVTGYGELETAIANTAGSALRSAGRRTRNSSENPPPLAGEGRVGGGAAAVKLASTVENPRIPHLDPPPQAGEEVGHERRKRSA